MNNETALPAASTPATWLPTWLQVYGETVGEILENALAEARDRIALWSWKRQLAIAAGIVVVTGWVFGIIHPVGFARSVAGSVSQIETSSSVEQKLSAQQDILAKMIDRQSVEIAASITATTPSKAEFLELKSQYEALKARMKSLEAQAIANSWQTEVVRASANKKTTARKAPPPKRQHR